MTATDLIAGTVHARSGGVVELSRCEVVVASGAQRGAARVVDQPRFRIGKANDNDLVLADDTVSRNHCEICRDTRGYLVRDLDSTNGTLLDGREVREAYLTPGSTLTVGGVELLVRPFAERFEPVLSERSQFGEVTGRSLRMREIFGLCERLAPTDASVLLGGETGTGKDLLARAVHDQSLRKGAPFVVVDCGAVVGSLIESELFGHERGAFTGAVAQRMGAFELAQGGTIFLDEVGELPIDLQPKLLRVLENRAFRRVGGSKEIWVDIRVIAASKRNLRMEVERGKFREDLFFRLAVVPLELPPLRERREDIAAIVPQLMARLDDAAARGLPKLTLPRATLDSFLSHDWPGNVRELRNVLERAIYLSRAMGSAELVLSGLPLTAGRVPSSASAAELATDADLEPGLSYREQRARVEEAFERRYVAWLLGRHDGNVSAAAREADMDRKYLYKLAKKHGLKE
jgi:transcriptional regulator with GAF, ATPase, and Fis domain